MKQLRLFFAAIATICSLTAIGQTQLPLPPIVDQEPLYFNEWFLPEAFSTGCASFPYPTSIGNGYGRFSTDGSFRSYAVAQPYFTDSILAIKGIAFLGRFLIKDSIYFADSAYYFQIRDASLNNVLAQVRYDTIAQRLRWQPLTNIYSASTFHTELLFDSTMFVSSKFYTVMTVPDPIAHENWSTYPAASFVEIGSKICQDTPLTESCWVLDVVKGAWEERNVKYGDNHFLSPATLFIFPILDTTPMSQCQFDATSIDDTTNSTITLEVVTSEHGFPLPHTIGFVFDTNPSNLNLNNPNVVYYPYDTNQSLYTWTLPYSYLLCNTTYYYRSFAITQLDTIFSNINSFIKQCSSGLDGVIGNDIVATLSPNPADKEITITTAIPMQKVEITNATGQKVYEQSLKTSSVKVNTSKFSSGSYIATIHTENGMVKKLFVINN
ncbi:MAG: T9SS type A sorting domain-containing protein [Bacteroidales bacterium]|nr:T9SS type A sorting domain-containing protein [Bacteroidales bacterium]